MILLFNRYKIAKENKDIYFLSRSIVSQFLSIYYSIYQKYVKYPKAYKKISRWFLMLRACEVVQKYSALTAISSGHY